MTTYYIRTFNGLDCEIDVRRVDVPDGADAAPYLKRELHGMLDDLVPEPGDTIRITRG
jgi:hypothetical protein